MLQAVGSLQDRQTISRSNMEGSLIKIADIVLVMGFPSAQEILRNVAEPESDNVGVYAIGFSFCGL
jgi:hypothetical protein